MLAPRPNLKSLCRQELLHQLQADRAGREKERRHLAAVLTVQRHFRCAAAYEQHVRKSLTPGQAKAVHAGAGKHAGERGQACTAAGCSVMAESQPALRPASLLLTCQVSTATLCLLESIVQHSC